MAGDLTVLDGNTFFVSDAAGDVEPGELPNGFFHAGADTDPERVLKSAKS
jgi:hypothetical protein